MSDESAEIVLQRLVASGKLSGADVAIMEETMKRDKIAKIHNHKIRHSDRLYTNVDERTTKNSNLHRRKAVRKTL